MTASHTGVVCHLVEGSAAKAWSLADGSVVLCFTLNPVIVITLTILCNILPLRGLFVIDDKGVLRQITINDLPVGRSVDETLRLVQAFQHTDKYGEGQ